jgi:hypothetical protein
MRAAIYVLVVAINLNQLFMPAKWGVMAPFRALLLTFDAVGHDRHGVTAAEAIDARLSLAMTTALSLFSLIGYGAVVLNSSATEVPMVIRAVDRGIVQVLLGCESKVFFEKACRRQSVCLRIPEFFFSLAN